VKTAHASLLALVLAASACSADGDALVVEGDATASSAIEDGSPQGVGVLAFLADAGTTRALLDGEVGIDKRAAQGIVAHRDGADGVPLTADDDRFDTVEELDAVAYVGPSAFEKLIGYASAHGFVPQGSDLLGVYDGVSFTVDEAAATLALVASADHAYLDKTLDLDVRAADGIVAAKPIGTVLKLSQIKFVGESALKKLKTAAAPAGDTAAEIAGLLGPAVEGLWHSSEGDYPFEVVIAEGEGGSPLTAENIKERIAGIYVDREGDVPLAEREVEAKTLASFFDHYTVPKDWWEPEHHEQAARYQVIYDLIREHVTDPQVFRIGHRYRSDSYVSPNLSGAIDVYIVGRSSDGHLVGLWTISIET
jgi:hypothetical protein